MLYWFGVPVYKTTVKFDGYDHEIIMNGPIAAHAGFIRGKPRSDNDNETGKYLWRVDVKAFHSVEVCADTEEEARKIADAEVEALGGDVDGVSDVEGII